MFALATLKGRTPSESMRRVQKWRRRRRRQFSSASDRIGPDPIRSFASSYRGYPEAFAATSDIHLFVPSACLISRIISA
jgi:hypothetical protein